MDITNDFNARYAAASLNKRNAMVKLEKLIPVFLRSGLQVYPHQIEAASSALFNPYSKGYILADEVGLGKAVEAGLVVSQTYYGGADNILIIVPKHQTEQWRTLLANRFELAVKELNGKDDEISEQVEKPIQLATYEGAIAFADYISSKAWDLAVIDEAHRLCEF